MVVVLIPAYKPDEELLTLLGKLQEQKRYEGIVVVDDGSGAAYRPIFDAAEKIEGVVLERHAVNQGKGRAIKTGINAALNLFPKADLVTADSDGQHCPEDIARIADQLEQSRGDVLLGMRIRGKNTPFKSKWGNAIMRLAFLMSTGKHIYDTQTGLRGFPNALLPELLHMPGERYEYEMNVLLQLPRMGVELKEMEIKTVYVNNNAGTHFHPVRDAMMVFTRILAFSATSLLSFGVDYGLYSVLLSGLKLPLHLAYICARVVSSLFNFTLNRHVVFRADKGSLLKQIVSYYVVVLLVMGLGTLGVGAATEFLHWNEYVAKIVVDSLLWVVSFFGQRLLVFKPTAKKVKAKA